MSTKPEPIFLPLESKSQSHVLERYLGDRFDFTSRYIALRYIHFYDTIHNVTDEFENNCLKYTFDNKMFAVQFPNGTYTFGDYNNYLHFTMKRNGHFKTDPATKIEIYGISLLVNSVYNVISVRIAVGYELIVDTNGTADFLGIAKGAYNTDLQGQNNPNITMSNDMLFVRCNIVNNSLIPEYNDVIFACALNEHFGQHVSIIPSSKSFLKCTKASTQSIKIYLTNQDGKPIKFVENKWGIGLDIEWERSRHNKMTKQKVRVYIEGRGFLDVAKAVFDKIVSSNAVKTR